jgi:hypothetical protein
MQETSLSVGFNQPSGPFPLFWIKFAPAILRADGEREISDLPILLFILFKSRKGRKGRTKQGKSGFLDANLSPSIWVRMRRLVEHQGGVSGAPVALPAGYPGSCNNNASRIPSTSCRTAKNAIRGFPSSSVTIGERKMNKKLPTSRGEALRLGAYRYFTGKPCKRGHVAERRISNGNCIVCHTEQLERWHSENPGWYRRHKSQAKKPNSHV